MEKTELLEITGYSTAISFETGVPTARLKLELSSPRDRKKSDLQLAIQHEGLRSLAASLAELAVMLKRLESGEGRA